MKLDCNTTPRQLAALLRISYAQMHFALYRRPLALSYSTFQISKKNGQLRDISAPQEKMKNFQRRLKALLDVIYEPHSAATAFIAGRSIVDNARRHTRKDIVFNIDLEDFYTSIHFGRVRGMLIAGPYNLQPNTASIIAQACCLNGVLPQGAPTSPTISNMICRRLDRELALLAGQSRAQYSRYADDITFSLTTRSTNNFFVSSEDGSGQVIPSPQLDAIISRNGFRINSSKTRRNRSMKSR